VGHCESVVHAEVHDPATQNGSDPVQSALVVHVVPGGGRQTPLAEQVAPPMQPVPLAGPTVHVGTHSPSSQTSPEAHWLEYLQTVELGSHEPPTQLCPLEQSELLLQGQGPAVPPHVTHALS
jgi:hypothetical protein